MWWDCDVMNEWSLTCPKDMVGFFLQIVIVSLCSLVLLMRMVRDRKKALKRGKEAAEGESEKAMAGVEEGSFRSNPDLAEEEAIQSLYRDDDDARV